MKNKIKIYILINIAVVFFGCISCSGKIDSEDKLYKYVCENYGNATLIRSERTDASFTCYFEDQEYHFSYWVESSIADFNLDNSSFFKFEVKKSNFQEQYYYALYHQIQNVLPIIEDEHNISISDTKIKTGRTSVQNNGLLDITFHNPEEADISAISQKVGMIYHDADTRGYWKQTFINTYDHNGTYLGKQDITANRFITLAEEELSRFCLLAKEQNNTAEYQYMKTVSFHDFSEIADMPIDKMEPQNESSVTLYYFITNKGVTFFVANILYNGECYSDYSG